ncbi:MAG: helix-turn-helix domain-containing protein [Candidatus Aminicenantes bacterium]|nr:helix-turn-helix domain-containing protein [Candidatus Aminicenantes bacterium]MDH5385418.1 helix-turn-helix domain-containing protein [Candidatus Aminicenantes bacterium]MDH5743860.1 helix-turn-helix domain-containing protein [Candidatus Aminicenantes bacterium]
MPDSTIVVIADSINQNSYRFLKKLEGNLKIISSFQAAKLIKDLFADIILIDCGYKNKAGLSLLKDIKRLQPKTPVVFLTDASSEELAIAAFRAGAREYFKKPVHVSKLVDTIKGLKKLKRNSKEARLPFSIGEEHSSEFEAVLKNENIPPRFLEVFIYANEHLEEELTLSDLANLANMSKHHFSRNYRKHLGVSPMKHVNILRINRSKELLSRKDFYITEIAFLVGYNDLNRFIRNFKKLTGQTPSEFRKKQK